MTFKGGSSTTKTFKIFKYSTSLLEKIIQVSWTPLINVLNKRKNYENMFLLCLHIKNFQLV